MKEIILKIIEAFSRKGEGFFYAGLPQIGCRFRN
jgi:hypothetical protein